MVSGKNSPALSFNGSSRQKRIGRTRYSNQRIGGIERICLRKNWLKGKSYSNLNYSNGRK